MNEDAPPIVCVVIDDASVREAVARLIRSVGLEVETFGSAREFLRRTPPDRPSCLVLDVEMPGLSGLDLQDELTAADLTMPIIFMTGPGSIRMRVGAMKAAAVDLLTKPIDEQALLDAIDRAIAQDVGARRERASFPP